jgi:hypothetical protein
MNHRLRCHSCGHIFHATFGRGGFRCAACHVHLRIKARAQGQDHLETQAPVENPSDAELMSGCPHCGAPKDADKSACGYCGGNYPGSVGEARGHHSRAWKELAESRFAKPHPHMVDSAKGCLSGLFFLLGVIQ